MYDEIYCCLMDYVEKKKQFCGVPAARSFCVVPAPAALPPQVRTVPAPLLVRVKFVLAEDPWVSSTAVPAVSRLSVPSMFRLHALPRSQLMHGPPPALTMENTVSAAIASSVNFAEFIGSIIPDVVSPAKEIFAKLRPTITNDEPLFTSNMGDVDEADWVKFATVLVLHNMETRLESLNIKGEKLGEEVVAVNALDNKEMVELRQVISLLAVESVMVPCICKLVANPAPMQELLSAVEFWVISQFTMTPVEPLAEQSSAPNSLLVSMTRLEIKKVDPVAICIALTIAFSSSNPRPRKSLDRMNSPLEFCIYIKNAEQLSWYTIEALSIQVLSVRTHTSCCWLESLDNATVPITNTPNKSMDPK